MALIDDKDNEVMEFTCKCSKCGSEAIKIEDDRGCGTTWTGCWGGIELVCKSCGNSYQIMEM